MVIYRSKDYCGLILTGLRARCIRRMAKFYPTELSKVLNKHAYQMSYLRQNRKVSRYKWTTYGEIAITRSAIGSRLMAHGVTKGTVASGFIQNEDGEVMIIMGQLKMILGGDEHKIMGFSLEDFLVSDLMWRTPEKASDQDKMDAQTKNESGESQESIGLVPETTADTNGNSDQADARDSGNTTTINESQGAALDSLSLLILQPNQLPPWFRWPLTVWFELNTTNRRQRVMLSSFFCKFFISRKGLYESEVLIDAELFKVLLYGMYPKLEMKLFLDDDIVVQKDLRPLSNVDLQGMIFEDNRELGLFCNKKRQVTVPQVFHLQLMKGFLLQLQVLFLVWERFEEENQELFKPYYLRLEMCRQIKSFNHLLEKQAVVMDQLKHGDEQLIYKSWCLFEEGY
ncbi:hypothetical protein CTI12_AA328730 [Artemisia annua]|uniref:Hexosyltransferase n=1 Tax=Artemisia annua TaxID=35608 RepID=A0A2U1M0F4_ARTAN|nr:hypothetical protein CTI12_AA328730 [Artemisia annua]